MRIVTQWEWLSFAVDNESGYEIRMIIIYEWEWLLFAYDNAYYIECKWETKWESLSNENEKR